MSDAAGVFDPNVLLTLQEHDSHLGQLQYRSTHLPEEAEIVAIQARRDAAEATVTETRKAVAALDTRQAELETKIHDVDTKIDGVAKTLYGGTVTSPRELQSLEADIASLKKHRGELEDAELEILVERESLDAQLAAVDASHAAAQSEQDALRERAAQERARLATEIAAESETRAALAAQIPADVLATYEKTRAKNKGIGAARLEHGTCMACRLKLSAVDLDRIRHLAPDAIARCEECGAILVR